MMENHRAPYMGGCTAVVVFFQASLEEELDLSHVFFSRRSRVRFVRIRVSTVISGLIRV